MTSTITTTPSTLALVSFLLARIDEDETQAKRTARRAGPEATGSDEILARTLSECLAKRKIIGAAQQLLVLRDQPAERVVRDQAKHLLTALALPYSNHRGFRPEWA